MSDCFFGGVAEWLKATDCKSVLSEYVGSNPTPSTILAFGTASLVSVRKGNLWFAGVAQW